MSFPLVRHGRPCGSQDEWVGLRGERRGRVGRLSSGLIQHHGQLRTAGEWRASGSKSQVNLPPAQEYQGCTQTVSIFAFASRSSGALISDNVRTDRRRCAAACNPSPCTNSNSDSPRYSLMWIRYIFAWVINSLFLMQRQKTCYLALEYKAVRPGRATLS